MYTLYNASVDGDEVEMLHVAHPAEYEDHDSTAEKYRYATGEIRRALGADEFSDEVVNCDDFGGPLHPGDWAWRGSWHLSHCVPLDEMPIQTRDAQACVRATLDAFERGTFLTQEVVMRGRGWLYTMIVLLAGCGAAVDAPAPEIDVTEEPAPVCVLDGLYLVSQIAPTGCAPSQTFQAVQKERAVDCAKCEPGDPSPWCEFESTLGDECVVRVTWEQVAP